MKTVLLTLSDPRGGVLILTDPRELLVGDFLWEEYLEGVIFSYRCRSLDRAKINTGAERAGDIKQWRELVNRVADPSSKGGT